MRVEEEADAAFLSDPWWDRVIQAWNQSPARGLLAGFGAARFATEGEARVVSIRWDAAGHAQRVGAALPTEMSFKATRNNWMAFVRGEYDAVSGVLTQRIRVDGSLPRLLPYVRGFDTLARVARSVTA